VGTDFINVLSNIKKNLKHTCWTERYFSKNFTNM